jgi:hypothetical protein
MDITTILTFVLDSVKEAVLPYIGTFLTGELAKVTSWLNVGNRRSKLVWITRFASMALSLVIRLADGSLTSGDLNSATATGMSLGITYLASTAGAFLTHKLSKAARGA